jgi:2-(1,2-epoxy-1,2-dihydrophenyl)acetyl-CoA isomerase
MLSRDGSVAVVRLNRPAALNALTDDLLKQLVTALRVIGTDQATTGVVLTATGRAFCAGGDVSMLDEWASLDLDGRSRSLRAAQEVASVIAGLAKPVVAAVNGAVAGAGLDLVLLADACVAVADATFQSAFGKLGLVPDLGGAWLLPRVVGLSRARRILLRGEVIDAGTARDWGLVDQVVSDGSLISTAVGIVQDIARSTTGPALRETKQMLIAFGSASFEDEVIRSATTQAALLGTPEHAARAAGFRLTRR